ncbi:hypothetical protein UFOVP1217_52 [uncultured Caudovirales phage]|uniref:Uncharacterized protein n=1 Tax=uncultured Caudovirales phage TaxID=2100421 RepID=A0A6J5PT63_9CAUD|nr:hypothetical protein UFOVP465_130 [uncultured Caudovirales phage]CAB4156822.1 hypothetical protein UFOVP666_176 [uncultured Caudovirales phage]CAB4160122.1 hypothetical protein UFOVP727_65 [uncultured Caudovirales phage]CAB4164395.1 hypothetical protein UFOVP819_16 [uncultured Caudovirales phage]CAB4172228.1 hypothetical protein UFOVP926_71 [uncultured Caudovirales phage]
MFIQDDFFDEATLNAIFGDESFFPASMGGGEKVASEPNMYNDPNGSVFSPYMFWDGWWKSPMDTLKKKLIKKIFEGRINTNDVVGFEYWTRTYQEGQYIQPHVDADTARYIHDKSLGTPILGSVWWGVENEEPSFFEIYPHPLKRDSIGSLEKSFIDQILDSSPVESRERIKYKSNRLIIFDAGHELHGTTPSPSGIKQSLIVNVWGKECPPLGLLKGGFHYETGSPVFGKSYRLTVSTPLGNETVSVVFDTDTKAKIEQGKYSTDIQYSIEEGKFISDYKVSTPMIANVSLNLVEDNGNVSGYMKINDYSTLNVKGVISV